jgi:phosphatidate cytidylyltransferase
MYLEQRTWKTLNLTALSFGFGTLLLRHLTTSQQQQYHAIQGLLFLTLPMTVWYAMAQNHDTKHALSLLLICWNCDTGALIVGRITKPYLPTQPLWLANISPSKSLAGMVGGLGLGTLTAVTIPSLWRLVGFYETIPAFSATLGVQLSVLAILGDLVESAIKRQSNQKDSSSLLPGHGGILDRFDSSFFAVVAYYNHLESNR